MCCDPFCLCPRDETSLFEKRDPNSGLIGSEFFRIGKHIKGFLGRHCGGRINFASNTRTPHLLVEPTDGIVVASIVNCPREVAACQYEFARHSRSKEYSQSAVMCGVRRLLSLCNFPDGIKIALKFACLAHLSERSDSVIFNFECNFLYVEKPTNS